LWRMGGVERVVDSESCEDAASVELRGLAPRTGMRSPCGTGDGGRNVSLAGSCDKGVKIGNPFRLRRG